MSPRILHAILACSFASLVINVALLYVIVSRAPRAAASLPAGAAASATGDPASAAPVEPVAPVRVEPFQREWEYVDKGSGRRLGAVVLDDADRLEQFVRAAKLAPAQELGLRRRYAERRAREMGLAREMVKAGDWHSEAFRRMQATFWADEYRALPREQSAQLPPEFLPPG